MFKTNALRRSQAVFAGIVTLSSSAALAQSTPGNVKDVVIREDSGGWGNSDPAAAKFDRNELTIVVTRHAWNLELAGPTGDRYVVIEPGHDSGVTCSDTALQAHLITAGTPGTGGIEIWAGDFEFQSLSTASPVYHQTTTWDEGSGSNTFGVKVTISAKPENTDIEWSDLGANQSFRVGTTTDDASIAGRDHSYTVTTKVVSHGVYGASIYTVVESNGFQTEYLTETVEVFGLESADGADADTITPGTTDPLGCCTFPCGVITEVTSSECDRFPGTTWQTSAACSTTNPTSNFCGGGTVPNPDERDDLEYQDGYVDPLDSACGTEDGPGTGAPTRYYNGMTSVAPAPIEQVTGEKIEAATDLSVDLSGTDFNLTRRHRSIGNSSNTLVGNGWAMGVFSFLDIGTATPPAQPVLTLKAPQGFVEYTESGGVWTTGGPTAQTIERAVAFIDGRTDGLPVYRLTEPGGWQMDFHRAEDTSVDTNVAPSNLLPPSSWYGLLHRRIDLAGNRWTFDYTEVDGKVRLASITCDRHDEDGTFKVEARISFKWKGANFPNNAGRLAAVVVLRPNGAGSWLTTHNVSYRYFDDLLREGSTAEDIAHLGSSGDLVEVVVSERLDDSGSTAVFRDRVTQYRYHDGSQYDSSAETVDVDSNDDGIPGEQGQKHQLKMVFNPFEVEYFAEHYRSGGSGVSLLSAADRLLRLADDAVAFSVDTLGDTGAPSSEDVEVARLASKVIARYDTSNRVLVQYLQASCGCGGSMDSTLGVRRKYEYGYADVSGTEYYRFTLTEASDTDGNGSFEDYRIYRTHHRTQTTGGVPRLYIESIEDGVTGDTWYKAYEYTSKGELLAVINASGLYDYFPELGTGNMGEIKIRGGSGHVIGYEYDGDSRVAAVYFRSGYNGNPVTNPSGWEKLESFERANATRDDLVTKHTRYRVAGSSNANEQEVTTYDYRFWDPVGSGATDLDGQFGGHIIAYKKTSVERELIGENGPGPGTYDTEEVFDVNGRKVLERAADGSLTEFFYSGDTEFLTKIVRNQASPTWSLPNTSEFGILGGAWTPLTGRSDGGSLTTEFVLDDLGRVVEAIAPGGITTYTYRTRSAAPSRGNANLLYYSEITLPHPISESGANYDGFASVATQTWLDASNLTAEIRGYEMPSSVAKLNYRTEAQAHVDAADTAGLIASRSATNIDWASKSIERRVWHDASDDDAFYLSQAQFDEYGRTLWQKTAVGDFTEFTYDVIDRVLTISRGTDRSTGSNNLVLVEQRYYDGSSSGSMQIGDSNLTQIVRPVDSNSANDRITSMYYDARNRVVFVENPLAPHSYTKYDNLNRPTEQHQLSELSGSDILSLNQTDLSKRIRSSKTAYSQRGLVYQTGTKIDPTSGSTTDFLIDSMWFDEVGRGIKSQPHSGPGTKTAFDGLGRPVHRFVGDMTGDGSTFTNVYDTTSHQPVVSGDIILQETVTDYIETSTKRGFGSPELVTNYERAHDASSTGSLSNFDGTGADATAVATFSLTIYDEASRPLKSGFYGTNDSSGYFAGGTAPTPPSNAFSLSVAVAAMPGTALISETVYDERGRAHVSIAPDPHDTRTRTIFDDLNRTIGTVENHQTGSVVTLSWDAVNSRWSVTNSGGTTTDENRVTSFVYDGANNLIKRIAHVSDTAFQETEYDYSYDGTVFDSNSLLSSVHYPNEGTGVASTTAEYSVSYEYNRQGDMTEMTDQNETVHEYVYDALGRATLDKAVTFVNTDLDQTVRSIRTQYSATNGLVEYVTSYDGTDPSTATVLNQIKYEYDSLLQLSMYRQNPTGAVGSGQSADVEYVYDREDSTGDNFSRLDLIKYPLVNTGGKQRTEVAQYYGDPLSPDLNGRISRSVGLDWTFQMKAVANDEIRYEHLGLSNAVIVDYIDGQITLDRQIDPNYTPFGGGGPRVAGEYVGMDQYGRLGRQVWYQGSSWDPDNLPARIDIAYQYDTNSDITRRYDSRVGASVADRGDEYTYDGLHRLDLADRGAPGSGTSWTSASKTEDWTLDVFGNWTAYSNSIGTSYTEDRAHNEANEITSIEVDSTTPTLEVTYDAAGNLRTRETVADTVRWVYTWDAWNRLVEVEIQEFSSGAWQTPVDRMESGYYGINQRAWSRIDKGAAGYTTTGPDEVLNREEHFYYDALWRLLERRTDTSWSSGTGFVHDETTQWVWGNRYIDELVAYATDTNATTSDFDNVSYAMTDRNFSVIGFVDGERMRYDAYGYVQTSPFGDTDGDGTVGLAEFNLILGAFGEDIGDAGYKVEADLDSNGTVDSKDQALQSDTSGDSIDRGRLFDDGDTDGNIIGYAGYVFEPATGLYLARNRWFSPERGRWLSRDPLEYVDGTNVYEYCRSSPSTYSDPTGLACTVWYICRLTGIKIVDNRDEKRCTYTCTEGRIGRPPSQARFESLNGGLRCAQVPKVTLTRDKYIEPCGFCPNEPYEIEVKYMDTLFKWGKCSRRECRQKCETGEDVAEFLCASIKNKFYKALCKGMASMGEYACEEVCDAFCKKT